MFEKHFERKVELMIQMKTKTAHVRNQDFTPLILRLMPLLRILICEITNFKRLFENLKNPKI